VFVRGAPEAGLDCARDAVSRFDVMGDLRGRGMAQAFVGWCLIGLGCHADAEEVLREAVATNTRVGARYTVAVGKHMLAFAIAQRGAVLDAMALLNEARDVFAGGGSLVQEAQVASALGAFQALAGEPERALAEVARAVAALSSAPPFRADALATFAQMKLRGGDVRGALDAAREAVAIARSLGSVGFGESHVRLVLVEALDLAGERDEARSVLREAYDLLLARARGIHDSTLRDSFLAMRRNAKVLALGRSRLDGVPA
jgi:tetratricopeptide (TPR) repeat protein